MTPLPRLDRRLAERTGTLLAPPGRRAEPEQDAALVAGLRAAAAASVGHVAEVTGLPVPSRADDTSVVGRRGWVRANVEWVSTLLPTDAGTLRQRAGALGNGLQVGGGLAALSTRVLGQYLPLGGDPRLLLVAPNVAAAERKLDVPADDFRLWVCLHEQTHRFQFAAAPWLVAYLERLFADLLAAGEEHTPLRDRHLPRTLLDVAVSPAQRPAFEKTTAVMSLLEGHADVMMDRVGPDVVPTVATIRRRFDERRRRGGLARVVAGVSGYEAKLDQYADGAAFCTAVIDAVGVPGLNAVFESRGLLPTLEELHAPQRWLARVHPDGAPATHRAPASDPEPAALPDAPAAPGGPAPARGGAHRWES